MNPSVRLTEIDGNNKVIGSFGVPANAVPAGWAPTSGTPGSTVNWTRPADVP